MDYSYNETEIDGSFTVKSELEPDNFTILDDESVFMTCETPIDVE